MITRAAPYDRDAALDAALALFWRKGFHATSLKDIEAELHMKPGSIYAAFRSKENLFRTVLERYSGNMRAQFDAAMAANPSSPLEALADYIRQLGRLLDSPSPSRACMLVKTLLESTLDQTDILSETKGYLDAVENSFAGVFRKAIDLGELPADADPQRLARRLQVYIFGLKVQAQRETSPDMMRRLAEDIADEIKSMKLISAVSRA